VALTLPPSIAPFGPPAPPPSPSTSHAPRPLPALGPCPPASPFAVEALPSTTTIQQPPATGTYAYRDTGTYQTSGATPQQGNYPTTQMRTVSNVKPRLPSGYTFEVTATLGDTVTTTTYAYMPPTALSQSPVGPLPIAGLYIAKVVTTVGKTTSTFSPLPPGLLLLEVPAEPGDEWNAIGLDPTTLTLMSFTGTQGENTTVNACGQVLDAITVHVDGNIEIRENIAGVVPTSIATGINLGGREIGPTINTTFTGDYAFVTQYGGLSVMDNVETTGTENGVGIDRKLNSTINVVPKTT
jgi:hypothetical protein